MKTVEDFKKKAKEQNIRKWNIHDCSGCGYKCGYLIDGDQLYYDNGCYCIMYPATPRDWQDLVDHYNRQSSDKYINEMNKFWGFE